MKDISVKKSTAVIMSIVVTLIFIWLSIPRFMDKDIFKDLISKLDNSNIGGYNE